MTTLVIHPFDPSTAFLSDIYANKPDWTIITQNIPKNHIKKAIIDHDRIIMLGHGCESGLYGFGYLKIDSSWVYLLRDKQVVCIWCNADQFVRRYELHGFYTGMIISEFEEALMYSVRESGDDIQQSNKLFASAIKKAIDSPDMLQVAKDNYASETNQIILFNSKQMFYSI